MAKGQQPTPELRLSTSCYDANGMHINQAIDFLCDHLINFKKYKEVDIQGSNFLIEDKDFKLPMFDQNSPSKARELVKKALKEVAKTPAGRLAIWTNIHHLTYDPETKTYRSVSKDMDENEKTVDMIGDNKVETIIIEEGAESIANEAFRLCPNLKKLYLPKTIKYIGDRIFKRDYSEVQIYYDGSTEEFMKIDFEREVYIPSKYDRYPYYSDYGASSEYQRFYR